jgi:hypothetical protein
MWFVVLLIKYTGRIPRRIMQIGWHWGVVGEWRFHGGENGSKTHGFDGCLFRVLSWW